MYCTTATGCLPNFNWQIYHNYHKRTAVCWRQTHLRVFTLFRRNERQEYKHPIYTRVFGLTLRCSCVWDMATCGRSRNVGRQWPTDEAPYPRTSPALHTHSCTVQWPSCNSNLTLSWKTKQFLRYFPQNFSHTIPVLSQDCFRCPSISVFHPLPKNFSHEITYVIVVFLLFILSCGLCFRSVNYVRRLF